MKKNLKKLVLHRETLQSLAKPSLQEALGGAAFGDGIIDTGCNSECTKC